jgi:transcriptional regulator with XRE-family HTH domain
VAFYSPEGLKQIALLLDAQLSPNTSLAQNELARRSGVSSGTIGNLRGHRHNHGDTMVGKKPDPDTLLVLAPYLEDPLTAQPFDPERLLAIARGQTELHPKRRATDDKLDRTVAYPEAVNFLKGKMGSQSEEEFAEFCRIPLKALREILSGRRPTLIELLKFGVLFADRNPIQLARLYGVNEDTLIDGNPDRRRSKQSHN